MFSRGVGIDHGLYQRVACQTVSSVKAGAAAFANGIQALDRRLSVEVNLYASAEIVAAEPRESCLSLCRFREKGISRRCWGNGARFLPRVFVGDAEINVVCAMEFHFGVDGASYYVARRERQARVIFLHELFAVEISASTAP